MKVLVHTPESGVWGVCLQVVTACKLYKHKHDRTYTLLVFITDNHLALNSDMWGFRIKLNYISHKNWKYQICSSCWAFCFIYFCLCHPGHILLSFLAADAQRTMAWMITYYKLTYVYVANKLRLHRCGNSVDRLACTCYSAALIPEKECMLNMRSSYQTVSKHNCLYLSGLYITVMSKLAKFYHSCLSGPCRNPNKLICFESSTYRSNHTFRN